MKSKIERSTISKLFDHFFEGSVKLFRVSNTALSLVIPLAIAAAIDATAAVWAQLPARTLEAQPIIDRALAVVLPDRL